MLEDRCAPQSARTVVNSPFRRQLLSLAVPLSVPDTSASGRAPARVVPVFEYGTSLSRRICCTVPPTICNADTTIRPVVGIAWRVGRDGRAGCTTESLVGASAPWLLRACGVLAFSIFLHFAFSKLLQVTNEYLETFEWNIGRIDVRLRAAPIEIPTSAAASAAASLLSSPTIATSSVPTRSVHRGD